MSNLTPAPLGVGPLQAFLRYRFLVGAVTLLLGAGGYLIASIQPEEYQSTATLVLGVPQGADLFIERGRSQQDIERNLVRQAARIESAEVLGAASERLDNDLSVQHLRRLVSVEEDFTRDAIAISAQAGTPEGAAILANSVAAAYRSVIEGEVEEAAASAIEELNKARSEAAERLGDLQESLNANPEDGALQAEFDVATQQLVAVSARSQQLAVEAALYGAGIESFETAEAPARPSRPQPQRTGAAAALLGLLGAGAFAWWKADRDVLAESSADVAAFLGAPLLGEVPLLRARGELGSASLLFGNLDAQAAEAYRLIATSLGFALHPDVGRAVIITSVSPRDGKTLTVMNVAEAYAAEGLKVAVLDGDVRAGALTKQVRGDGIQRGNINWRDAGNATPGQVSFAAADTLEDGAGTGVERRRFRGALEAARGTSDIVLVDTPPVSLISDSLWMATQADGVVMVVSRGTSFAALQEVQERLALTAMPIVGFVFNRAKRISRSSASHAYYANEGVTRTAVPVESPDWGERQHGVGG